MGADYPVLVDQGQFAVDLEHPVDHEHHVRPPDVILVEHQRRRRLQGPGQDPLAVLGHLLAVAQHDGVLAQQIDAADVTVEVDAKARPVEARRHLLDMGGFSGAVIALDHHPAVIGEAGEDGDGGVGVEIIGLVEVRHLLADLTEGGHHHVAVEAEHLADRYLDIRFVDDWGRRIAVPGGGTCFHETRFRSLRLRGDAVPQRRIGLVDQF